MEVQSVSSGVLLWADPQLGALLMTLVSRVPVCSTAPPEDGSRWAHGLLWAVGSSRSLLPTLQPPEP